MGLIYIKATVFTVNFTKSRRVVQLTLVGKITKDSKFTD
ncbi:hypothetical protein CSUNSWCD_1980 [Campylobacter showae CSUNSWCD]|uniref:Uncharacterized protein n=1 Tax=Campylobacter showae CSUNSWCD TaxID=1244083 RepID=M5IQ72_9BACT|nr:hypothetical protein CSUNSWCD_1980 [Campylobacter showae CSUNSWCD]